ncbi:23S rRNA (pseudouridine(1915)-N(3))-methyltransferase RlmH [Eubacteriales bacterium OttesenSCG-928-A19]|nr:23S rRNA (pseudouridine(1915)-N(3))-methyltransferase RlmH [Eubacteriales bacterium OttesenSCG-928-A19]
MKTAILCVGKLRERYWRDAAEEYVKRLSRFGGIEIVEIPDLPEPRNAREADLRRLVDAEGASLLSQIAPRDHVIALAIGGRQMDSPALAARLSSLEMAGESRAVFLIGGSNGLSEQVLRRANGTLSFSPMTFPHQLARVMLLEQLYRARKILAGEAYHK